MEFYKPEKVLDLYLRPGLFRIKMSIYAGLKAAVHNINSCYEGIDRPTVTFSVSEYGVRQIRILFRVT